MFADTNGNPSLTQSIVGGHFQVGKKIGEGSFGVVFEGASPLFPLHQCPGSYLTWHLILGVNLLNSQSVAIKFVGDVPSLLLLRGHSLCSDTSTTL
jgi:hypothetical protein